MRVAGALNSSLRSARRWARRTGSRSARTTISSRTCLPNGPTPSNHLPTRWVGFRVDCVLLRICFSFCRYVHFYFFLAWNVNHVVSKCVVKLHVGGHVRDLFCVNFLRGNISCWGYTLLMDFERATNRNTTRRTTNALRVCMPYHMILFSSVSEIISAQPDLFRTQLEPQM